MFSYTLFDGFQILACGSLEEVTLVAKRHLRSSPHSQLLAFSDQTGQQMDLDIRGSSKEIKERLKIFSPSAPVQRSGAGRPKLGVIAREVSLLPAHWEWLANQAGGASSAIRKLIDEKLKGPSAEREKLKFVQEVTYKVLSALAGNLPNFEDAIRYLYRRDRKQFESKMKDWPKDVRMYALKLSESVFAEA